MGILGLGERQRVRLFVRRDAFDRFVSCLVFIPARPLQHREPRARRARSCSRRFGGDAIWTGRCCSRSRCSSACTSSSHSPGRRADDYDVAAIEARLAAVDARLDRRPARRAGRRSTARSAGVELFQRYDGAFPAGYREDWPRALGRRRHRPDRASSRRGRARSCALPPARGAGRTLRCKLFSSRRRVALRRAARPSSTWGPDRRRAAVRDHAASTGRARGSTTSACAAARATPNGCASLPGGVPRRVGGASTRTTRSTAWCSTPR